MSTKRCRSTSWQLVAVLGAALLLAFGREASAQVRPIPAPSVVRGGASSDLFPFVVGVLFFLTLLTVVVAFVLLPLVARALGGRVDVGRACLLAVPLAALALFFLWGPLHLREASAWVTLGGLLVVILSIVAAVGSAIFRNREEAFFVGVVVVATTVFYVKTSWGFWLSLLAGVGVLLLGAAGVELLVRMTRLLKKPVPRGPRQAR